MGLAVIISSVNQVNDMSETSLNSLAKRYWIVFYAFSKDKIKAYQGTGLMKLGLISVLGFWASVGRNRILGRPYSHEHPAGSFKGSLLSFSWNLINRRKQMLWLDKCL